MAQVLGISLSSYGAVERNERQITMSELLLFKNKFKLSFSVLEDIDFEVNSEKSNDEVAAVEQKVLAKLDLFVQPESN